MNKRKIIFLLFSFLFCSQIIKAQTNASLKGAVLDEKKQPISGITIYVESVGSIGTATDKKGYYHLKNLPSNKELTIVFSAVGYENQKKKIILSSEENRILNIKLKVEISEISTIDIINEAHRETTLKKINPKLFDVLPTVSGNIEDLLKSEIGVSTNNELSSQYRVRGGNFDENMVYVNGIEIYRPFLIRSGQQEGLSFTNPAMVSSIYFSAGGFNANYGDKMSSVLDITYKKPTEFGASLSLSMLGGSVHFEGASENKKFTHITGVRYKTTEYVLNTMETEGDYKPSFIDVQTYLTYDISPTLELGFLGNYAINNYNFTPKTRQTNFGTLADVQKLTIVFDGQEVDEFKTFTGALALDYNPNSYLNLKFITSVFNTQESETFDVFAKYSLGQLDGNVESGNFGEESMNIGTGKYLDHARNFLNATIFNFYHKGKTYIGSNRIEWGAKIQHEKIDDKLNEWRMVDSAGYSIPYNSETVNLYESAKSKNNLSNNRFSAYIQNNTVFYTGAFEMNLTAGIRGVYWDFNNDLLISPRITLSAKPDWSKDIVFRFSTGYYYQPPFYRELRDFSGELNKNIKAQKSIHFVGGLDYNLKIWNRPFKFITEIYHKKLDNIIPYEVDNVRIRYYANQKAKGHVTGIDMKLNGEFVEGVDSWVSLSVMEAREDIYGDGHGYIPRPTDQIFNFGIFFQDYFPGNKSYKMQLSFLYGAPLPFGPPKSGRHEATMRMPQYLRSDLGFSKVLLSEDKKLSDGNPFRFFKSIWLTGEVFNLFGMSNTISYSWINVAPSSTAEMSNKTYHQLAVPNRLTSRRINIKLIAKF